MKADSTRQSSHKLTFDEAVVVHKLLQDGWLQSRIAAKFDTNIGRISEIKTGKRHPGSRDVALKATRH